MASEIEELFDGITNPDQEVQDEMRVRIDEQMENPQFIFFLLQSLTDDLLKENPTIYKTAQITIFNNIRRKWVANFSGDKEIFWSPETQENIVNSLIESVFTIPNELRSFYIAPLRFIIKRNFIEYTSLIDQLIEIFSQNKSDILNTNTYLQIVEAYSKAFFNRYGHIKKEQKDFLEVIKHYESLIMQTVLEIIPSCICLITQYDDACVILYNAIRILRYSSMHVDEILMDQSYLQALSQIFELITFESEKALIHKIKSQIYKLITYFNPRYLSKRTKLKTESCIQFANHYQTEIIPPLIESSIQSFQMSMDYQLRIHFLDAIYQFLFFSYGVESFTLEIIIEIIMSNARLTEEEADEIEVNPAWYIDTQLEIQLLSEEHYTPRTYCAEIVGQSIEKMNFGDELYQFFFTDSDDVFELEAKLFLFYKYVKKVLQLDKEQRNQISKKKRRNLSPLKPRVNEEDFQSIFQLLENDNPPFLEATILRICTSIFKYIDPRQGIQISQQVIIDSEIVVLVYYGAKMFNTCIKAIKNDEEQKGILEELDIPKLIEKLISVSSVFHDKTAPSMISLLCKISAEHLATFGPELINVLFELSFENYINNQQDECNQGCREIFTAIYNIIVEMKDDSELLNRVMGDVFENATKIMDEIEENFDSFEELFEILGLLNQKMTHTQTNQLEMLEYLLPYYDKIPEAVFNSIRQITQFIYPLITSPDNALSKNQDLCQSVITFTEQILQHIFEEITDEANGQQIYDQVEGDISDSIGYSLFLASCIVQVFGSVNTSFIEFANSALIPERLECLSAGETFITVMGALSVYAAYFIVDPQIPQDFLNEEMIESITKIIKPLWFTNYRNMAIGIILLLNFASMGSDRSYYVAAKRMKDLIKYKNEENNSDDDDEEVEEEEDNGEEEEEEEEDDGIRLLMTQFPVPFDNYNVIQLFKDVSDQRDLFSSLPEDLQAEILELIN